MAKLTNDEYVAIIRREIEEAQGYDSDALQTKRQFALDYYHGKRPVAAAEGRSQIVSTDVRDTVHSTLAQVMPIFSTSMVNFEPNGEQDEPQAQMESDFVQRMIERNQGYEMLYAAAFDALLQGNGWIKVDIKHHMDVDEQEYTGLTDLEKAILTEPNQSNQRVELRELKGDKCKIIRRTRRPELLIETVAPDRMLFSGAYDQLQALQELRFVAERVLYTESDLKKLGIPADVIDRLPWGNEDYWPAVAAREGIYQDYNVTRQEHQVQDAERLVEVFDCHIRIDIEQNGESELRRVLISGRDILVEEPAPFIPYCTGSPIPMPHRVQGTSLYELFAEIQDSKTSVLRKFIDSLEVNVLGRYEVVEGKVNLDDLMTGRAAGIVRSRQAGSVVPLATSQAPQEAIVGLNYLDSVREQRGGASLEMNDADAQIMKASATAAAGVMKSHEEMAGFYARNLVNTLLKPLFQLVHSTMRLAWRNPVEAKIGGKWQQTDPRQWPERQHLDVLCGMTTTERATHSQNLTALLQMQMSWQQGGYGGMIVDGPKIHAAAADWIRAADLGDPAEYLIDPASPEAQQAAQHKAQQAQQQAAMAQRMTEMEFQLEQQKLELDRYKIDAELRWKYYDSNLDAEVDTAKMTIDAVKAENGTGDPNLQ